MSKTQTYVGEGTSITFWRVQGINRGLVI